MDPRLLAPALLAVAAAAAAAQDVATLNRPGDGYRGIWYANQPSGDEYAFKYSGGLGTYCAKHQPFAVYRPEVDRTFFCYGGTSADSPTRLQHFVSTFDHATGQVPRPTLLLDKGTADAHDNPVLAVDDGGRVWVFSTSHGRSRPSFVHRSLRPYDVSAFERVEALVEDGDDPGSAPRPLTNFSYMQAWHVPGQGFACFFTRYGDPVARTSMFLSSADGVRWRRRRVAAIAEGHYQISAVGAGRAAAAFNVHPEGQGLNWRTNLYYLETPDLGATWRTADGTPLALPVTHLENPALVHDYAAEGLKVYLKDLRLDAQGRPLILYVTSRGYEAGPANDPRTWTLARWTGERWRISPITTSDNNYDMGSLYLDDDALRVLAPTEPGPQRYNPGGEVAQWVSRDGGVRWARERQLTAGSARNHTYVRRPIDAQPGFRALWADGDARTPSASRLHFADAAGRVFRLPERMAGATARPEEVPLPLPPVPPTVLSEQGCGRATAYDNANKIVTVGDRTHVVWLDSTDEGFRVRARTLDDVSLEWSATTTVGEAADDHGGPALTVDSRGYLHVAYYPHHHPVRTRRSLRPNDASAWTAVEPVGRRATYPTLACGPDDTLYLMVRESDPAGPWRCDLYRKPPGGTWGPPTTVLEARAPGYCQFGQHLAFGPDGRLHLGLWIYEDREHLRTTIGYLASDDGGRTWTTAGGAAVELPATSASVSVIATSARPGVDVLRGGPLAVDGAGRPHVLYRSLSDWPSDLLLASPADDGTWSARALTADAGEPPAGTIAHAGSIAFTSGGQLRAALTTLSLDVPDPVAFWGHPSHGVAWLADGALTAAERRSAAIPCWLPSIERPTGHHRVDRPAWIHTEGPRGESNDDRLANRVVFERR